VFWFNLFLVWVILACLVVLFIKGASIVSSSTTDKE
jgi:hypothetical protein